MKKQINIGLFGFGCVGSGLYEILNRSKLVNAKIKKIVVKDPDKIRSISKENFSFRSLPFEALTSAPGSQPGSTGFLLSMPVSR